MRGIPSDNICTIVQICKFKCNSDLICVPDDTLRQEEVNNLGLVAMHHMPNDMPPAWLLYKWVVMVTAFLEQ